MTMGHHNLKSSLPGLVIVILVVTSVSLLFSTEVLTTQGRFAPIGMDQSKLTYFSVENSGINKTGQIAGSVSDGNADVLMTASIVAIVVFTIVMTLAILMLLKGKKMMKGKGPLFQF